MRALLLSLISLALAAPVAAQEKIDPCKPPQLSIGNCPNKFLPTPHAARNPDPNDPRDVKKLISNLISQALHAETEENVARLALDAVRENLLKAKAGGYGEREKIDTLRDEFLKAQRTLEPIREAKYRLYQAAMSLTVRAYGLEPPQKSFPNDFSLEKMPGWEPRFSELEIYDNRSRRWRPRTTPEEGALKDQLAQTPVISAGNQRFDMGLPGGKFWPKDGRISIFRQAFVTMDPDDLASLIYHETVHWVDFMSDSRARMDPYEEFVREARAYSSQAVFLQKLGKTGAAASAQAISDQFDKQAKTVARLGRDLSWPQLLTNPITRTWLPPSNLDGSVVPSPDFDRRTTWDDLEQAKAGSENSFYEGVNRLGEIAGDIQEGAAAGERERRERNSLRGEELRKAWKARDRKIEGAWEYLRTTAGLACSAPEAFAEQMRSGAVIDVGMSDIELTMYLTRYSGSGPGTLNSCESHILAKLNRTGHPVRAETLLVWAKEYRDSNPTLLRRFTTSIGDFFKALAGMLDGPDAGATPRVGTDPGEDRTPSQPERGRENREPHDSAIGGPSGTSWDQLRGIDSGRIGFD
ncbi:MAG: hypothetical protein A2X36_15015 [Elusimicrobia bacterium GWA2_69_24]|nr:MAG: hypothetical protein A2X36_15015 [Elusimicrobia bacterium GWA2_69_24]HBL18960.1 hypothetical protein [Elusimicrobiota bacterium]